MGRKHEKLDYELAQKIRKDYATGKHFQKDLAVKYGVSKSLLNMVVKNQIWTKPGPSQPSGENHGRSKLTAKIVRKIRRKFSSGKYTEEHLADKYGVTQTSIFFILTGKQWKDAGGPIYEAPERARPKNRAERVALFWSKVNKIKGGCWEWTASTFPDGYGQHKWKYKNRRAHKLSYELTYGKVPKGLEVMHSCDNRICVKPKHLSLGTHQDNMDDMVAKGRSLTGSKNPNHPDYKKRRR